jgi:hypothetical protein
MCISEMLVFGGHWREVLSTLGLVHASMFHSLKILKDVGSMVILLQSWLEMWRNVEGLIMDHVVGTAFRGLILRRRLTYLKN